MPTSASRIDRPQLTDDRIALYNRHKIGRDLLGDGDPIDAVGYHGFLIDSCTDSFEISYFAEDELVGVAIVDRSEEALSAVYTYFDPEWSRFSPGRYSVLKQLELCRLWGLRYLYLGLYVHGCAPMNYKASYLPHERLVDGYWQRFESRAPE